MKPSQLIREIVSQLKEWGDYPEYVEVIHSVVTDRHGFSVTDLWQLLELVLDGEAVIVEPQPDGKFAVMRANGTHREIKLDGIARGFGIPVEAARECFADGFVKARFVSFTTKTGPKFRSDSD